MTDAPYYVEALMSGHSWADAPGEAVTVGYAFLTPELLPPDTTGVDVSEPFATLNDAQIAAAEQAMASWAAVANVTFVETSAADADITFGGADLGDGIAGFGGFLGTDASGEVWISTADETLLAPVAGDYAFQVFVSVVGYALGLKRALDWDPTSGEPLPDIPVEYENDREHTILSLFKDTEADDEPRGPMLYDIAAVQHLYGANTATNAGDTTYDLGADGHPFMVLWDGGGHDTIDLSGRIAATDIDLRPGYFTDSEGLYNFAIAYGTGIKDVIGSGHDDRIAGGAGNDGLHGGGGKDVLNGGAGNDLLSGGADGDRLVGGAGGDILAGGDGADTLIGGAGNDRIDGGGAGNDRLVAGAGDDTAAGGDGNDMVSGGAGSDTLSGGDGADTLAGGAGDDLLLAGDGADTYLGGAGFDTLDFSSGDDVDELDLTDEDEPEDAEIAWEAEEFSELAANDMLSYDPPGASIGFYVITGSDALIEFWIYSLSISQSSLNLGDLIVELGGSGGIDNLAGSLNADGTADPGITIDLAAGTLTDVDGTAETVRGADTLDGGGGKDTLDGGAGDDLLSGGYGDDLFVFGTAGGTDRITDFVVGADALSLADGMAITGIEETDIDLDGTADTVVTLTGGTVVELLGVSGITDTDDLLGPLS